MKRIARGKVQYTVYMYNHIFPYSNRDLMTL